MCWLADTPLWVPEAAWVGRKVVDRYGHELGRVSDVLVDVRSIDETAPDERGVRAAFAAVDRRRGFMRWRRPEQLLLAVSRLTERDGMLEADEDALALRPLLFGRE